MNNCTIYSFIKYILETLQSDRFSIKEMNQFYFTINVRIKSEWSIIYMKYNTEKCKFIIRSDNNRLKMKFIHFFANKRFYIN